MKINVDCNEIVTSANFFARTGWSREYNANICNDIFMSCGVVVNFDFAPSGTGFSRLLTK